VSLVKTKDNKELWGTVDIRGHERPRLTTRVGFTICPRIDDYHILMISGAKCGITHLVKRELTTEQEYVTMKKFAFIDMYKNGMYPAKNFINRRCIIFRGGTSSIPREHRQYRITDKPIGK